MQCALFTFMEPSATPFNEKFWGEVPQVDSVSTVMESMVSNGNVGGGGGGGGGTTGAGCPASTPFSFVA